MLFCSKYAISNVFLSGRVNPNIKNISMVTYIDFYVQQGLEIHGLEECGPWNLTGNGHGAQHERAYLRDK